MSAWISAPKTSVVASNGRKTTVQSIVGWPRDYVSRTVMGRDLICGAEVLDRRMALDVVRPLQRGGLKYLSHTEAGIADAEVGRFRRAARLLVNHVISELDSPKHVPVYGVIGSPSRADMQNKQFIIDAASEVFDAAMVVPEPLAVAYGMDRLDDSLIIDVGAGTTDVCPMYGTYPAADDQLTLPVGGDSIDETFCRLMTEAHPDVRFSVRMARDIKEQYGYVHDVEETAPVVLPINGVPQKIDVAKPLQEACRTIVPPLVDALKGLIAGFDPEFRSVLLNKTILCGGGSQLTGLDRLIEQEAFKLFGGGRIKRICDPYAGAAGALKIAIDMQAEHWEQIKSPSAAIAAA